MSTTPNAATAPGAGTVKAWASSAIAITLDIYGHVNPAMDAEAANRVATLIRENT